jgi:hypothetical protein
MKTALFMVVNADCFCICCGGDDFRGDSFHVPHTVVHFSRFEETEDELWDNIPPRIIRAMDDLNTIF